MGDTHFFDLDREWETFVQHLMRPSSCYPPARKTLDAASLARQYLNRPAASRGRSARRSGGGRAVGRRWRTQLLSGEACFARRRRWSRSVATYTNRARIRARSFGEPLARNAADR